MSTSNHFHKNEESIEEGEELQDGKGVSTLPQMSDLVYRIDERPPWMLMIMMAVQNLTFTSRFPQLQHFSANFGGSLVLPILLSSSICFDKDPALLTRLIATTFFITGVSTILQIMLGSR
ncbi:Solute carrier family 23 member 2 [Holothuria leucospilota]|uniref:Solute carrier family 23 member 2 n=1 Tax=Holothuria leucospilota TaxID=206669 RepID=A0A9Q1HJE5_HOLLE|nr:Solute carrier family 23 member 2 [Holothuria leucospilota]